MREDFAPVQWTPETKAPASGADPDLVRDDPYVGSAPDQEDLSRPPLAAGPPLGDPGMPYDAGATMGETWAARAQPAIGWGAGSYALAGASDSGAPRAEPDMALPALRDGGYLFNARLKNLGDQGVLDPLIAQGGSYLDVHQAPYWGDDRPAGR